MITWKKPSPALVIAVLALFVSLSGTAVAAGVVPLAKRALTADKAKVANSAKVADNAKKVGGQTAAGIITQAAQTPGPASGVAGLVSVKQAADTIQPNTGREVVIACDAGKKVLSGGWSTTVPLYRPLKSTESTAPVARSSAISASSHEEVGSSLKRSVG